MANYAVDSLQDGCYPGTVVLINILGIQNQSDLDAVEGTLVPAKAALWEEKPLAESFDFAHYCAIRQPNAIFLAKLLTAYSITTCISLS